MSPGSDGLYLPLPAIIHYSPDPADCAIIERDQVWLIYHLVLFLADLRLDILVRLRRYVPFKFECASLTVVK